MKPNIVILGDSHVRIYNSSEILNNVFNTVKIIHTDSEDMNRNGKFIPYLLHTISTKGEIYLDHYMEMYKDVDYMMFIFGEPDVRIHINKQINICNRNEDEVIETLCKNYINKLLNIVPKNIKIIIRYILPQRVYSMYGSIYVPVGHFSDRVRYTNKMNSKFKELCANNNILFFDNYKKDKLINDNGTLKDEFCDGLTHYNLNAIEFINKEILIFNDIYKITI